MEGDIHDAPKLAGQLRAVLPSPEPPGWRRKEVDAAMAGFVDI